MKLIKYILAYKHTRHELKVEYIKYLEQYENLINSVRRKKQAGLNLIKDIKDLLNCYPYDFPVDEGGVLLDFVKNKEIDEIYLFGLEKKLDKYKKVIKSNNPESYKINIDKIKKDIGELWSSEI